MQYHVYCSESGQEIDKQKIKDLIETQRRYESIARVLSKDVATVKTRPDASPARASQVDERVYVSGFAVANNATALGMLGITHILSVTVDQIPSPEINEVRECKNIPVLDMTDQNIVQYFGETFDFIETAVNAKGRILIHWYSLYGMRWAPYALVRQATRDP